MAGAFRDDLEAARSRAEALREENEDLREELTRLRAAPRAAEAETRPAVDRGPDSLTRRTLARLEQLIEDSDAAPPREEPAEITDAEPLPPLPRATARPRVVPAPSPSHDSASPQSTSLAARLDVAERQLAEATAERDELRAGRQRNIRSFWVGIAIGLALGALCATVLR